MERQRKVNLNNVLDDIYKDTIPLDKDTKKKANTILDDIKPLLEEMKIGDKLFSALYQGVYYSGSFYDGLRVAEPTEFDLNIILKLKFLGNKNIQHHDADWEDADLFDVRPGYAVLHSDKSFDQMFSPNNPRYDDYKGFKKFFKKVGDRDADYIVDPNLLLNWFEGVVTKGYNRFSGDQYTIGRSKSGPAHTLKLTNDNLSIDIDLVPVIVFSSPTESTTLVPKPHPRNSSLWRLSYPTEERAILKDNSAAKKLIKLLKKFRDVQNGPWKKLSSYYIKTFVMLEMRHEDWHERDLGVLFIRLLRRLQVYLAKRNIPFYFDERYNLLEYVPTETIKNMECRLKRINKEIERNSPTILWKYFKPVSHECESSDESVDEFLPYDESREGGSTLATVVPTVAAVALVGVVAAVGFSWYRSSRSNRD